MEYLLFTLFVVTCVLLILVVLLQKGRGGGLGAAFGGAGSSAFGTRVGDVFTWVTIVLTALFLLLAIGTTMYFRPAPEKVAMPIFRPAPETINVTEPISVEILCPTMGAEIHYTLDGSEPTKDSSPYQAAIRVNPDQTIHAKAYRKGGWTPSEIASATYGARTVMTPPVETSPETTQPVAE